MPWEGGWEGTENCPASIPFVDFRSGVRGGRATAMVTRGCGIAQESTISPQHTQTKLSYTPHCSVPGVCAYGGVGRR